MVWRKARCYTVTCPSRKPHPAVPMPQPAQLSELSFPKISNSLPVRRSRFELLDVSCTLVEPLMTGFRESSMGLIRIVFVVVRSLLRNQAELAAENLALRQQLAVLQQHSKRPRLRRRDRILWVWLSRIWTGWRSCLIIVQPDTVIR